MVLEYIYILLITIFFILLVSFYNYRQKLKYMRGNIFNSWGKQIMKEYKQTDLESITRYYKNIKPELQEVIDDTTWNDLNMDEVYNLINNTQSSVGEEYLYRILRQPLFDEVELLDRDELIGYFEDNEKKSKELQFIISNLGKDRKALVSDYFYNNEENIESSKLFIYRILSILPIISLILMFFTKIAFLTFIASIVFNSFLHYILHKKYEYKIEAYNYITSLIKCADKIIKCNPGNLKDNFTQVNISIKRVKTIKNNFSSFSNSYVISDIAVLLEYFSMFLLIEVMVFEKIRNIISKNSEDFKRIYEFVGIIDSCIAIASYRKSLSYYTKPVLTQLMENEDKKIDFKELYHPLIKDPVANSCNIKRSILLTGSNASGKSTFLKTIAINSILGQTIYTCLAKEYSSNYFMIYTSIALSDNILNNESYYIVEIKSLKRIMDGLNRNMPCMCFVDEILRGTNAIERISASSEVLNYLAASNCICIGATHDVELTHILENVYDNYHFQEQITDNQVIFDYLLYKGRSQTRNAIKLLSIMGYDENIVSRAEERAEIFLKDGIWRKISNSQNEI